MHFSPQNSSIFDNDYPFKIVLYPTTKLIKIFGNQIFINNIFYTTFQIMVAFLQKLTHLQLNFDQIR